MPGLLPVDSCVAVGRTILPTQEKAPADERQQGLFYWGEANAITVACATEEVF
jgi:hypothetical protein